MEPRFGALRADWGEMRRRRLDRDIAQLSIVQADDDLATACADLRHRCQRVGHALGDKIHDGDRWVAAVAILLGVQLVSHDGVFEQAPGLELITERLS
jgi:predicted nucleic acid-binding protein